MHDQALADSINPMFGELHRAAADSGDWQQYVQPRAVLSWRAKTWLFASGIS
jgi:hypothetical protein